MKISNPLTIIAVFAGVAEALATISLINLPLEIQVTFVYFVMFFPTLLVLLFFLVLALKSKVLYAPSDFVNENNYLAIHDFKQAIDKEIHKAAEEINKEGEKLSPENIERLKSHLEKSLDSSFRSSRREQILSHLSSGPKYTKEICTDLDIHHSYATLILRNLADEGIVKRENGEEQKGIVWSLNA
ncbi:hypothetical protein F471_01195 [Pseudomonas sp. URMO17WK12:I1]|uniref:MarR family transcriptional regulator n=1 Tax=unclassified Pseudomonas TaxID=196821 RepID=UPI000DB05E41|nr:MULTISPECIES: MarR family transcriptional regulator [unclassified Pseudomonas]PZW69865.1 hypothetical protein F471_01195 [Pseudomonas sp. URMO17WK12:I1]